MVDNNTIGGVIDEFINKKPSAEVIQEFCQALYSKFDLAFHFDDDFNDYIDNETKEPLFNRVQAEYLNKILDRMIEWCDARGIDIHEIAGEVQQKEFKKRGIIPDDTLEENGFGTLETGEHRTNLAGGTDDNFFSEDIELTEGDAFDKIREGIKVGCEYYDQYLQKIFVVDGITSGGFVECTNKSDKDDKFNVDLVTFKRYLNMGAYEPMFEDAAMDMQPQGQLAEDEDTQQQTVKVGDEFKFAYDDATLTIDSIDGEDAMVTYTRQNGKADKYVDAMWLIKMFLKTGVLKHVDIPTVTETVALTTGFEPFVGDGINIFEDQQPKINGLNEPHVSPTTGYNQDPMVGNGLFEDQGPLANATPNMFEGYDGYEDMDEGYVNKEFRVAANGNIIKIVSATPPLVFYRVRDEKAIKPRVMGIDQLKRIIAEKKIVPYEGLNEDAFIRDGTEPGGELGGDFFAATVMA